jgi:hypothetical protein
MENRTAPLQQIFDVLKIERQISPDDETLKNLYYLCQDLMEQEEMIYQNLVESFTNQRELVRRVGRLEGIRKMMSYINEEFEDEETKVLELYKNYFESHG